MRTNVASVLIGLGIVTLGLATHSATAVDCSVAASGVLMSPGEDHVRGSTGCAVEFGGAEPSVSVQADYRADANGVDLVVEDSSDVDGDGDRDNSFLAPEHIACPPPEEQSVITDALCPLPE